MKKIFSILILLTAQSLFAQEQQPVATTSESQVGEQEEYCIDDYIDDDYENSRVDADENTQPKVSWPGRLRDPFYQQVLGEDPIH